jgi:hypothetical protein
MNSHKSKKGLGLVKKMSVKEKQKKGYFADDFLTHTSRNYTKKIYKFCIS